MSQQPSDPERPTQRPTLGAEEFHQLFHAVRQQIARAVVGQEETIEHLLVAAFAGGHVLLTGMPGLGRTRLVGALGQALGLDTRRMQFTPDLLPSDIIGTEILEHDHATGRRDFRFFKGPVFANLVLVDEINRSPTRTQSALLEVMQERQVTSGGQTFSLPQPFMLVATENSLDSEGVWRLGEAQVDRFMMCVEQSYPSEPDERRIVHLTTGTLADAVERVTSPERVIAMQSLVRQVPVVPSVKDFALAIVRASRPGEADAATGFDEHVRLGASPRAAQALLLSAKATALARGRTHVTRQDVVDVARPVMVHRLLLDVRAEAEGQTHDALIDELVRRAKSRILPKVPRVSRQALYANT